MMVSIWYVVAALYVGVIGGIGITTCCMSFKHNKGGHF